ncbi:hypothetical protein DOTSEDRAFT_134131 [Dothistroma septosporum NZE10]|uniref:FAD-binding domain-containing protein n=1 Tax=Dothistroma septosporum (strain NZE10 / CBS 128990) TaxID=675120 RepID=N1PMS5_DOTSN|nr:hypothetical protein DOTSEDRAFT_134131 [Dothistroma septosporum NZE10]
MDIFRNRINVEAEEVNQVLIIGAGVTGLALAQGLKKIGIPCVVYEKNEDLEKGRDWDFGVHWGLEALKELLPQDLFDLLETTQVDPYLSPVKENYGVPLLDGSSGKLIKVLESSKCYRLRRDTLRKLLSSGLDVRYGKELAKIELTGGYRTVAARFIDGQQTTGRLLIGCDGAHSLVRSKLVGDEAAQLQSLGFATAMCYSKHTAEHAKWLRSPPFHPLHQLSIHPDGDKLAWLSIHNADDKNHPEDWTFLHYISYPTPPDHTQWTTTQLLQHQKTLAKTFCDPWKSLYNWMPDASPDPEIYSTNFQTWDPSLPTHAWDNQYGRVTLAGSSAHPIPPLPSLSPSIHHGASLQDALDLCHAIQTFWKSEEFVVGDGIQVRCAAIKAYEVEMKERGGREVRVSEEGIRMVRGVRGVESKG